MDLRHELHRLVDDVFDHDPRRALLAVRLIGDEHLPWLERLGGSVRRLREFETDDPIGW